MIGDFLDLVVIVHNIYCNNETNNPFLVYKRGAMFIGAEIILSFISWLLDNTVNGLRLDEN